MAITEIEMQNQNLVVCKQSRQICLSLSLSEWKENSRSLK